jgi:2-oxoisovalerate dehydrogenase E2 component (dihydrolipoyl transacylase)
MTAGTQAQAQKQKQKQKQKHAQAKVHEQVFRLPDLGEGLAEAEVLTWRVAEGDTVQIDQVVVEVETAKAVVEVPVPYAGTVLRLHVAAGTVLSVGEPLITVGPAGSGEAKTEHEDPSAQQYREEEQAGSGNVLIGYGTGHAPESRRKRRSRSIDTARVDSPISLAAQPSTAAAQPDSGAPLVISPVVRKLAKDHGVDLARLTPSGSRGVILRRDVEAAISRSTRPEPPTAAPPPAPAEATGLTTATTTATTAPQAQFPDSIERIPLTGLRRTVAEKLSRSRTEIPDATTWVDVDATALLEAKAALKAADPGHPISLLALLARFCVAGLRRYPELNSSVDAARAEIVRYPHVNLGFAAQTDRGLMVPVVRDAHRMTTAQLSAELGRLAALARTGGLPATALTGGTFTLNNYGVFGVDGSTPIINHPEAALFGVGRIIDKPWVVNGALAVRKVTQLSLTFDHRVCDGGVAGGFLRYVADCVENPTRMLADV